MSFIIDFIKGIFIGVANIIPGVSGGTMAVSMGVYDKLVGGINKLTKKFKDGFFTLLPLIIGMVAGIGVFSFIIPHCLENYTFITAMCFTGLVIGGIPELLSDTNKALKKESRSIKPSHIITFLVFVGIALFMALMKTPDAGSDSLKLDFVQIIILVVIGIIASATMVVPGVSGSLLLMMLGYYSGIIGTISSFLKALKNMDTSALGHCVGILLPFGIGCVLGVFLISKLISFLFRKFESVTYSGILGLVVASPVAIFCKTFEEYSPKFDTFSIVIGVVILIASAAFTYIFGEKTKTK